MNQIPKHRKWAVKSQVQEDLKRWKTVLDGHPDYPNFCHPLPDLSKSEKAFYMETLESVRPAKLFIPPIPLKESREAHH
ncbi:MAG: hypothetical protein HEQ32_01800 [Vampirovibrio sp.]